MAELVPLFDVRLTDEQVEAVADTLRSGWLTLGPRTAEFEEAFAAALGTRHAVATSSCTAALHLAYLAAGVGPGDEVIVPAITFVASAAAARYCGATPVFADVVGQRDLGIDPEHVASLIGERTKAVCAVHYAGYAADVAALRSVCSERGAALVEDAAHAPSARPVGADAKLGTYGLAGAFSFFSNKVLSCGEGGLLATDDDEVAALARSLRSHAMTSGTWDRHRGHAPGYDVTGLGYNYRLDEPRAALLLARLPGLEDDIAARRALVHRYRATLRDVEGLTLPYDDADVDRSSCYVMPVMIDNPSLRDPLRERLLVEHRVQTSVLYPAVHELSAYRDGAAPAGAAGGAAAPGAAAGGASSAPAHAGATASLPRAERAARTEVTLPLYPHLSEADQDRVIEAVTSTLTALRAG